MYYKVYFSWVSGKKIKRDHVLLDAYNKEDAKKRTIRGEKPKLIKVNKIVKA